MTVEQKAQLDQVVWIDRERMSGAPCLPGRGCLSKCFSIT